MNLRKLAGNVATGFFISLFLAAAIVILAPFVGWHFDVVLSGSMEPAIPTGSMVVLGPVHATDIRAGDVIAFKNGGVEVCHRVVAVDPGPPAGFVTQGDANRSPDGVRVSPDKVTGKLVATIPWAGYLIYFVKTPVGLFLTILLPLLLLIGKELKALLSDRERRPGDFG